MNGETEKFFGELVTLQLQLDNFINYCDRGYRHLVYWTTKDGKKILIKDLDDNHLDNIIKMIESKGDNTHKDILTILRIERDYRDNYDNIRKQIDDYQKIMNIVF